MTYVHDNQPWQEVAEECRRGISHARTLESFDSLLAYIKQLEGERDHWKQEAAGLASEQRVAEAAEAEIERLREYYEASEAVERGVVNFDLHADGVERIRKACAALARTEEQA